MTQQPTNLGVPTDWGVFPCHNCDAYKPLGQLVKYGELVVCLKCESQLEKQKAARAQASLFDDQATLF